jgi:hypothetical protein
MRYALLINERPGANDPLDEHERAALTGEYMAFHDDPRVLGGERLRPAETATTVRLSDGELLRAAELIERAGARAWSEAQLKVFVSRAMGDLDLAEPTAGGAAGLRSLGCLITSQQP